MNTVDLALPADKLRYWLTQDGDREVLFQPIDGEYLTFNWHQINQQARCLITFLRRQGLQPGAKIAILSKNCAHWMISDLALMLAGYVSIPIYPTANASTIRYILQHSEAQLVFVGKLDDWQSQQDSIPDTITTVAYPYPTMPADHQWNDIINHHPAAEQFHTLATDDLMTILYTSGSTGDPKGAMHTVSSFINAGKNIGEQVAITSEDRIMSYLPLAHCTERAYVESTWLSYGLKVYFVESLDTFANNLTYSKPTVFGSVPRLWTQFQKKILSKLPNKKLQLMLKIPILSGLIKRKIQQQMGLDQAHTFVSGSAPLSKKMIEWYRQLDINIAEGWGMTESFACGTCLRSGSPVQLGTVSTPLPGVEIQIAADSEILIKTQSDMLGYYKDPEKTKETINSAGFIHTGDLGELRDGYLSIIGRKKDIFKTEKGKYVAPIPIESEFGDNEYIEQMCLMGTHLVQPVLVVNLSEHAATQDPSTLENSLISTLNKVNQNLESHAKVAAIMVAKQAWTTHTGELTPTLKVKRHVIEQQFLPIATDIKSGQVSWH